MRSASNVIFNGSDGKKPVPFFHTTGTSYWALLVGKAEDVDCQVITYLVFIFLPLLVHMAAPALTIDELEKKEEEEFRTGPLSVLTTSVKTNSQV